MDPGNIIYNILGYLSTEMSDELNVWRGKLQELLLTNEF